MEHVRLDSDWLTQTDRSVLSLLGRSTPTLAQLRLEFMEQKVTFKNSKYLLLPYLDSIIIYIKCDDASTSSLDWAGTYRGSLVVMVGVAVGGGMSTFE